MDYAVSRQKKSWQFTLIVGTAAVIRWLFVILPSLSGTLKSTRISTLLSFTSTLSIDNLFSVIFFCVPRKNIRMIVLEILSVNL